MSLACFRRLGAIDVRSIILRRVLYLDHKGLTKKISPIVVADTTPVKNKKNHIYKFIYKNTSTTPQNKWKNNFDKK